MSKKFSVIWNLTQLCSYACTICCVSAIYANPGKKAELLRERIESGKELPFRKKQEVLQILDEFNRDVELDLSGGDLLLDDKNIKIVKEAATRFGAENIGISITGAYMEEEIAAELKDLVSLVEVTIDGPPGFQDSTRPYNMTMDSETCIRRCKKYKIPTRAITVLKKNNSSEIQLEELAKYFSFLEVNSWEFLRYYPVGRAQKFEGYVLTPREYKDALGVIDRLKDEYSQIDIKIQHSLQNLRNAEKKTGRVGCDAVQDSIGILPDGTILACAWAIGLNGEALDPYFVLGKLPEENLDEIMDKPAAQMWLKQREYLGDCHSCDSQQFCNPCKVLAFTHFKKQGTPAEKAVYGKDPGCWII